MDAAEAKRRVDARLQVVLQAVAREKGCHPDDLSVELVRVLEDFGLWCCGEPELARRQEAVTREVPTMRAPKPSGLWNRATGGWEDEPTEPSSPRAMRGR